MAIIRKTVSGLKPDSNYLFAVKPKNTEISASDTIPDSIRIKTPSSSSVPSGITGFEVRCNFESVMFIIQPVADQDFAEYEYEIYDGETISSTLVSTGKKRSTVFVISVANTTRNVNPTTGAETVAYKKYYGRVRAINTSGTGGAWTALATHSGNIPLIEDQYISSLTAGKITSGLITAEQIILQQPAGTQTSYTPPSATSVLRSSNYIPGPSGTGAGWLIRGDGYAEFDATYIRGSLSASSIALNAYNYWRPETSPGTGYEFEVGNGNDKLLKWNTTTGVLTIKGQISGGSVGGLSVDTGKIYLGGTGDYDNVNTAFYVDSAGKFSLKRKLTWDGNTLTIDGTVTIGGSTASTVVANANGAIQSGGAATDINNNTTTISGGKITANSINVDRLIAGTLTGYTIQNNPTTPNFKVDSDGNLYANNIYATGSAGGTQQGLTIRSDGTGGSPASTGGSLYIFSAIGIPSVNSSQYKIRLGASSRYLEISYPVTAAPNSFQHVNIETPSSQHLRLNSGTGKMGLMGNIQNWSNDGHDTVFVAGDIVLTNYGSAANTGDSRTVFSSNIGGSPSTSTIRRGSIDAFETYAAFSSLRELKENIEDLDELESINIIKSLRPRKFTWKPLKTDKELAIALRSLDVNYGFIAEEVEESNRQLATYKMTPEFQQSWPNVTEEMINEFPLEAYKDAELPPIIISAVKNLIERVEYLEAQLAAQ